MPIAASLGADPMCQEEGGTIIDVRHMTPSQLRRLGVSQVVYLREGTVDGETMYQIHAADGSAVGIVEDIDVAVELVTEHGLTFVTVH
jgi:hypothetical protein